jgi:hypothetical protein
MSGYYGPHGEEPEILETDTFYTKLFRHGNKAQEEKLLHHRHKTGIYHLPIYYALERLRQELSELSMEIHSTPEIPLPESQIDYGAVRREFADIANFAHMGIYTCDKIIERKKDEEKEI